MLLQVAVAIGLWSTVLGQSSSILSPNSILPAVRGLNLPVGVSQVLVPPSGNQQGAPNGVVSGASASPVTPGKTKRRKKALLVVNIEQY